MVIVFRYGKMNQSIDNSLLNSNQQTERITDYIETDLQLIDDNEFGNNCSSHLIKTGSGILIGNKQISDNWQSAEI